MWLCKETVVSFLLYPKNLLMTTKKYIDDVKNTYFIIEIFSKNICEIYKYTIRWIVYYLYLLVIWMCMKHIVWFSLWNNFCLSFIKNFAHIKYFTDRSFSDTTRICIKNYKNHSRPFIRHMKNCPLIIVARSGVNNIKSNKPMRTKIQKSSSVSNNRRNFQ